MLALDGCLPLPSKRSPPTTHDPFGELFDLSAGVSSRGRDEEDGDVGCGKAGGDMFEVDAAAR